MLSRVLTCAVLSTLTLGAGACASGRSQLAPAPFPRSRVSPNSVISPPLAATPVEAAPIVAPRASAAPIDAVVQSALTLRGVPYHVGGDSPSSGFDCSGFVRYVFAQQHIDLPRTVAEQWTVGFSAPMDDVEEGDLIFFSTTAPGPSHVALALGNGEFIHAPSGSGIVRIERLDARYWHDRIVAVKRLF